MKMQHITYRFASTLLIGVLPLSAAASSRAAARQSAPKAEALLQAAKDDDREAVRSLLARHVDVDASLGDGFTALHWAAYNDDVVLTKLLLAAKADPEPRTRLEGDTPLFLAAANGDPLLIDALLAGGANVSTANDNGTTPLMEAAAAGPPEVLRHLLAHGADINAREKTYGQTALFFAASHNRPEAIQLLADRGADTAVKTSVQKLERISVNVDGEEVSTDPKAPAAAGDNSGGHNAAARGSQPRSPVAPDGVGNNLAGSEKPANAVVVERGKDAATATAAAVASADQASAIASPHGRLQNGAAGAEGEASQAGSDIQAKKTHEGGGDAATKKDEADAYGFTRADRAARVYGSQTMGGLTALHIAARDGQLDAVRALLEAHANINAQTATDQSTPLLLALINGHYDVAKYLIDHNADVKLTSADGLGPLYALIDVQWPPHTWYPQPVTAQEQTPYLDLLKELIDRHADVNAKLIRKLWFRVFANDETWVDVTSATPFWRAAYAGDLDAMKLLVASGADANAATRSNDTPLMVAAGLGWAAYWTANAPASRLDSVKFCLAHGADINAKDIKGYSAIHGAAFRGDNLMIEFMLAHGADLKVTSKTGDTVADSANGLFEHAVVHPDTVALLEKLGSKSNNNCRSNECVVPPKPDRTPPLTKSGTAPQSKLATGSQPTVKASENR